VRVGRYFHQLPRRLGYSGTSSSLPHSPYLSSSTQFGLISVGFEKYGSQEALEKDAIKHLFDIYVKINKDAETDPNIKVAAAAWFKRMEDGDETALANWRVWRELSIRKYAEEYARLNVHFDVYTGESEVGREWQDKALAQLEEMGLVSDVDGAKLIDLEKYKLQKAVVRKKGASTPLMPYVCPLTSPQTVPPSTSRVTLVAQSSGTRGTSSTR
jgi:hypothetical protein